MLFHTPLPKETGKTKTKWKKKITEVTKEEKKKSW